MTGTINYTPLFRGRPHFWTVLGIWGVFFFFFETLGVLFFVLIALWRRSVHIGHVSCFAWPASLVSNENLFRFPALSKANVFNSFPFNSPFFTLLWHLILVFDFSNFSAPFAFYLPSFHFYAQVRPLSTLFPSFVLLFSLFELCNFP